MALSRTDYGAWRSPATGTWRLRQTMSASVNAAARTATITSQTWLEANEYSALYDSSCHHYQTIGGQVTYNGWINRSVSQGGSTQILGNSRTFHYNAEGRLSVYGYSKLTNSFIGEHWVEGTLVVDAIAPLAPSGLKVTPVSGGHKLDWTRNATYTTVYIDRRVNGGSWVGVHSANSNLATWTDTNPDDGNKYEYRVRAQAGASVWSAWSNTATILVPASPVTGLAVARGSDSHHTVSWTESRTVVIQRETDDGSWTEVARPSGEVTSWTDTGTVAERRYRYRVAVLSPGGQSSFVTTGYIYTTPAAPTGVSATRVGDDIQVEATGLPTYFQNFNIEDDGSEVASGVGLPWTHVSPSNAVTHRYRVQAVRSSGTSNNVVLTSAWSDYSETVQLAAPPNAPSHLSPNGVDRALGDVRFAWRHNPVDSSSQTGYELRYRPVGGSWVTLSGTTALYRNVALEPGSFEWQVRTKGTHADWSAWSSIATVAVIDLPTVAVTVPDPLDRPTVTAGWVYGQAQARPQSSWRARLLDEAGQLIEERSGTGATSQVVFQTLVADGGVYIVEVEVAAGDIWSLTGSTTFATDFVPPHDPIVSGEWSDRSGVVNLSVMLEPEGVVPVTMTIERDIGDGWVEFFQGDAGAVSLNDARALSNGVTRYRVTVFTVDGVASWTVVEVVADSLAFWIGAGSDYGETVRLPFDPKYGVLPARLRGAWDVAGGGHVPWVSARVEREFTLSGRISERYPDETAQVAEVERVLLMPVATHLLRTPDGRCEVVQVTDHTSFSRDRYLPWEFSISFRRMAM